MFFSATPMGNATVIRYAFGIHSSAHYPIPLQPEGMACFKSYGRLHICQTTTFLRQNSIRLHSGRTRLRNIAKQ